MDLSTTYMGFTLPHPLMPGASPLVDDLDTVRRLEDAGAAAIVMHSLFEEQIVHEQLTTLAHAENHAYAHQEARSYLPEPDAFALGPDAYLEQLRSIKAAVRVPVIASLNGTSLGGWLDYARLLEQAGADALELNLYEVVTDLTMAGAAVEYQLTHVVKELKQYLKIPIAVKVSPFFSAFANLAGQLDKAGADGIVLFNRFYQPDIDVNTLEPVPQVELSTSAELRLRLRWLAILHGRVRPSLIATGGVATTDDGIKALLAGADAVQVVSAILRHGPAYFTVLREGLERWMERHQLQHLDDVRGRASLKQTADPAAFERANYIRVLQSWKTA
jgi:dihydroorotate dehydrogenase (fumarate)